MKKKVNIPDSNSAVRKKNKVSPIPILEYLSNFQLANEKEKVEGKLLGRKTVCDLVEISGGSIPRFTNEFWTSGQRQGNSLHEVSYRACFKPQLPRFFIDQLSIEGDTIYDPFSGRGTTAIEAALLNRKVIANDINPLSAFLCKPRLEIPAIEEIKDRLVKIKYSADCKADIDLSMFYSAQTEAEIVSLKKYLSKQLKSEREDHIDRWIRMVATNRLTGHSANFFSVYTLPPNQAVSAEKQQKINRLRKQKPVYKNTKEIILKKSKDLLKNMDANIRLQLKSISIDSKFLTGDARATDIQDNSVQLTVTSPPFLDVVQYAADNWLRCWFNEIDVTQIEKKITMSKKLDDWLKIMQDVFIDLYRITKKKGWIAFEVGEVRNGKIRLDEEIIPLGCNAGFECEAIVINEQQFTKTANIWGVKNNKKGTNTNRIVLFQKKNSRPIRKTG